MTAHPFNETLVHEAAVALGTIEQASSAATSAAAELDAAFESLQEQVAPAQEITGNPEVLTELKSEIHLVASRILVEGAVVPEKAAEYSASLVATVDVLLTLASAPTAAESASALTAAELASLLTAPLL